MLRTWTTSRTPSLTALTTLSLALACSSVGTQTTEDQTSQNSDDSGVTGGMESTVTPTTDPTGATDPGSNTDLTTGASTDATGEDATSLPSSSTGSDVTTATETSNTDTTAEGTTGGTTGDDTTGEGSTSTGAPDGCEDAQQSGDETDVDCGGAVCGGCVEGKACNLDTDCLSGACDANLCVAASCIDAKKNGGETDIDCGGPDCDPCLEGEGCLAGKDCESGVCDADLCLAAACDDKVQNSDETDVDCGGATCQPCGVGLDCVVPADCQSLVCTNNACTPPTCNDAVQNGMEEGVDCGGNACAPCQLGSLIINEVDYDNIGDDIAEFVEIYNNTGGPVELANIRLVLVNGGNNATYLNLSLAAGGMLLQGQYLVVGPASLTVPPEVVKVNFVAASNSIQNGSPDGVALVNTTTMTVLDALSYEGPMTSTTVTGVPGMTNLVEGMALNANIQDNNEEIRSLIRFPNGNDKNNAATDWIISKNPTPGAANKP